MTPRNSYLVVGLLLGVAVGGALGWANAGAPGAPTWMREGMGMGSGMDQHMAGDMGSHAEPGMMRPADMHGCHGCSASGSDEETPEDTDVAIRNTAFEPRELRIRVGDTVTWTNLDAYGHTVTSDDGRFGSDLMERGDPFFVTFSEAGTYRYHCEPHSYLDDRGVWQGQTGVIVVE